MAAIGPRLAFNTHLHVPPNFSAFTTVEDAVETAAAENVKVIGTSNFHDFGVYDRFDAAAREHGLKALFGLEFISVLADEQRDGVKINDPANPGRAYICGKGIPSPTNPSPDSQAPSWTRPRPRTKRARRPMVDLIGELFEKAGLEVDVTYGSIVAAVAAQRRGARRVGRAPGAPRRPRLPGRALRGGARRGPRRLAREGLRPAPQGCAATTPSRPRASYAPGS